jgi:hypothetical protein
MSARVDGVLVRDRRAPRKAKNIAHDPLTLSADHEFDLVVGRGDQVTDRPRSPMAALGGAGRRVDDLVALTRVQRTSRALRGSCTGSAAARPATVDRWRRGASSRFGHSDAGAKRSSAATNSSVADRNGM